MDVERICFNERGFSTVGVVLALLITLSLIFTTAQVYRVNSLSSGIQETADAAALASENVVAEFYLAARVCDAVVLSLYLTSLIVMGAGVVALPVPASTSVGMKLINVGIQMMKARDSFAVKAAKGLNALQRALPFLAAASAYSVASENSKNDSDAGYFGFALLLPAKGEEIEVPGIGAADDAIDEIQRNKEKIAEAGEEAEEADKEANKAKKRAFEADCGNNPGRCMYERAKALAHLDDFRNPLYRTVDAWDFSVALNRARAYYPARASIEHPDGASVTEQAKSALRKRFYEYASGVMDTGYVREFGDSFSADFPLLPRKTAEMRKKSLYTEIRYPITVKKGKQYMHAFEGCPEAADPIGYGSIQDLDLGDFEECAQCKFNVDSMGNIASATTNTGTGFEHYYRIVAEAAEEYEKARDKERPARQKVKELTGSTFRQLKELMKHAGDMRIDVKPPGRYGSLAIVASTKAERADEGFESGFVHDGSTLGTRAAISSAVLASDDSNEAASVVSSLVEELADGNQSLGMTGVRGVLDVWSSMLKAYADGYDGIEGGIEQALGNAPIIGSTGLGQQALDKFTDMVDDLGLKPARIETMKPILSNTIHPLEQDQSKMAVRFLRLKKATSWMTQNDLFSSGLSVAEAAALEKVQGMDDELTIATVAPFGSAGGSESITFTLPPETKDVTSGLITYVADRLRDVVVSITGARQWR